MLRKGSSSGSSLKMLENIKVWQWLGILAALFLIPQVVNYYKKMTQNWGNIDAKNEAQDVANNQTVEKAKVTDTVYQQQKAKTITSNTKLHSIASNVATFLHVNLPWYDPRYYYEEDEAAFKELMKMPYWSDLKIVAQLYNQVYAIGRNLHADCALLMDEEYFKKIKW